MSYFDALTNAMTALSKQPKTVFVGQGIKYAGTSMTDTFKNVPVSMKEEVPVAEDFQTGFCIGIAMAGDGWLPVSVYPRWNFLLCAANQLVNHLDRIPIYSGGRVKPKVILRTAVPSKNPFDPGPQHDDDFTDAFADMLRTVQVWKLRSEDQIIAAYRDVVELEQSVILVEYAEHYRTRTPSGVMP